MPHGDIRSLAESVSAVNFSLLRAVEAHLGRVLRTRVLLPAHPATFKVGWPPGPFIHDSFVYRSMLSVPRYSMGLKLTTRDPENFGLLILKVADGTAGSLLVFFEHWLMSFHSPCDARY